MYIEILAAVLGLLLVMYVLYPSVSRLEPLCCVKVGVAYDEKPPSGGAVKEDCS
jgi:hypothetical protein